MSVRDYAALNPAGIVIKPPNSKALKFFGVSEEQTQYKFDGTVNERMAKIAKGGASHGNYTTGMATAKLGGDIIEGFESRKIKLDRKKKEREELKKQKAKEKEKERVKLIKPMTKEEIALKEKEDKKQEDMQNLKKMAPGANKLNAFLSSDLVEAKDEIVTNEEEEASPEKPQQPPLPTETHPDDIESTMSLNEKLDSVL